jgi:hypothetical protein
VFLLYTNAKIYGIAGKMSPVKVLLWLLTAVVGVVYAA